MPEPSLISRRQFLRQTVAFSALAGTEFAALAQSLADSPKPDSSAAHMLMVGDWGTDSFFDQQIAVSKAMQQWSDANKVSAGALFMLGDNWYGTMWGGRESPRWRKQFEDMYPASHFAGPAYAVLGNHDYEKYPHNKVEMQLN